MISNALLSRYESFTFIGIPQLLRVPQSTKHLKPITDSHSILLSTHLVSQFLKTEPQRVASLFFFFSPPENPTVLKDPPMSSNKNMMDLLCPTASTAIPSQVLRLASLKLGACSPQPSAKFRRSEMFTFLEPEL